MPRVMLELHDTVAVHDAVWDLLGPRPKSRSIYRLARREEPRAIIVIMSRLVCLVPPTTCVDRAALRPLLRCRTIHAVTRKTDQHRQGQAPMRGLDDAGTWRVR